MADLLRLEHVSKTFSPGTVHEKKAVEDLSLALAKGDFVTVIGSNGAGKSTLFGAIAGSFFPDGGKILLDGEDITFLPEHRRSRQIGRLFQDPLKGTAPHMTIQENLALAYLRAAGRRSPWGLWARRSGYSSGSGWRRWAWGWKTGWKTRWASFPAASARPLPC